MEQKEVIDRAMETVYDEFEKMRLRADQQGVTSQLYCASGKAKVRTKTVTYYLRPASCILALISPPRVWCLLCGLRFLLSFLLSSSRDGVRFVLSLFALIVRGLVGDTSK